MNKSIYIFLVAVAATFSGCKKWDGEHTDIYTYTPPAANPLAIKLRYLAAEAVP